MLREQTFVSLPVKAGEVHTPPTPPSTLSRVTDHLCPWQRFIIPWRVLNTNPRVWGENAAEFDPTRWLVSGGPPLAEEGEERPWLALMQSKVMLAVLVRAFEFKQAEGCPISTGTGRALVYVSHVSA